LRRRLGAGERLRQDRSAILEAVARLENAGTVPVEARPWTSSICRQSDFNQDWFIDAARALGTGTYFHRSVLRVHRGRQTV
jgi:hypothetical protein